MLTKQFAFWWNLLVAMSTVICSFGFVLQVNEQSPLLIVSTGIVMGFAFMKSVSEIFMLRKLYSQYN